MKKILFNLTALSVLLLMTNCGPKLSTTKMTDKDLGNYKTFAYLPSTNFKVPDSLVGQNKRVAESVIMAMNENMKQLGYTMDRKNPDILVLLNTKFDTERMREVEPVYASYPYSEPHPVSPYYENYYFWDYNRFTDIVGYDVDYSSYKEGVLIVEMIDRKSKKKLWKGIAEEDIYRNNTSTAISEYVDDIFDEYPKSTK